MGKILKLFYFALAFMALWSLSSCNEDDPEPILNLNGKESDLELLADAEGEVFSVKIISNLSWSATSSENWCLLENYSQKGDGTLVVKVSANSSSSERNAKISLKGGPVSREVSVKQAGKALGDESDEEVDGSDEENGGSADNDSSEENGNQGGNGSEEGDSNGGNEEPVVPKYFFITLTASPREGGVVSGWGLATVGAGNVVTATANDGYEFVEWSDGETSAVREVTSNGEGVSLTAYFEKYDPTKMSGYYAGYAYVDLGLSVMWATYNVGGSKPTDFGDLFAWGETSPKEYYKQENYKWGVSMYDFTKYCTKRYYGSVDEKTVLDRSDDAASANWGASWRMPTADEMAELVNGCDWEWMDHYNGTNCNGQLGKSKKNGNVIFLPASGMGKGYNNYTENGYGYYWTKSLYEELPTRANNIHFGTGGFDAYDVQDRVYGMPVRPVFPR